MTGLPFTKVEGLGNDFVVVDLRAVAGSGAARSIQDPAVVRAVCDRHFGVGADGVLAIVPGVSGDARMRVLNADGSEAEMCGNGLRCVAKVLYESDPTLRRPLLRIDTGAGRLDCAIDAEGGLVRSVAVEMGRPRLTRGEIPMSPGGEARVVRETISARGRSFEVTAVSMGNPHAIIFVDDPFANLRALAEEYGPALEVDPMFPRRTNVELARVRQVDGHAEIDLVVWERGCGITLACGTGACATVAAACVEERLHPGVETPVHLPGGTLHITVAPRLVGVRMRGPAVSVFRGELDLASLTAARG
ncbi:MAG TPA: diaminopimelate epimerase [Polyangia bacterium]|nr:diaminopimelate epimerase [Polyangia bacterium]